MITPVAVQIQRLMRDRNVGHLQDRMEYTIWIREDPVLTEGELDDNQVRDSTAIYDVIAGTPAAQLTIRKCSKTRSSQIYLQGGFTPADDNTDRWDVIIPGGLPESVKAGNVAIVLEDDIPIVYTISNINQDRLSYIARFTMEDYGSRRA